MGQPGPGWAPGLPGGHHGAASLGQCPLEWLWGQHQIPVGSLCGAVAGQVLWAPWGEQDRG